ncbi:MAG TPA: NAD-dependent epimerase/dehydratase family protein, partial [Prolixibacteraceae bacterium]|nr:NAD-dependent epimerase/dehydratase family protein [Prolixibacteraceae bacterium]
MLQVAVTGASGHIGNCLVRELKKQGAGIRVLAHNFRNDLDEMDVEVVPGNLLDPDSLKRLCKGADVVFHLAARVVIDNRMPDKVLSANVKG